MESVGENHPGYKGTNSCVTSWVSECIAGQVNPALQMISNQADSHPLNHCFLKYSTPLTHQRFLNRYMGSYGPAIRAGESSFPFPGTPVQRLLVCGDSTFPGIGVPAVAGSGILAANSVSWDSLGPQLELLAKMREMSKKS